MATNASGTRFAMALIALAAFLGVAARASLELVNFRRESPRATAPPRLPTREDGPARVVVFVLDGLRVDASERMPALQRLRKQGASAVANVPLPSFSRPGYTTMATGVPPAHSGVRNNAASWPVRLDSIFDRAQSAGMHSFATGNIPWWHQNFGHGMDRWIPAPRELDGARLAVDQALAANSELTLVHLINLDAEAHHHGVGAAYAATAEDISRLLERALAQVDLARDAVIVSSDHGHRDRGGHGGPEPEVVTVPLIIAGKGAARAQLGRAGTIGVIGPTAAVLLGIETPRSAETAPLWAALDPRVLGSRYLSERAAIARHKVPSPGRPSLQAGVTSGAVCGGPLGALLALGLWGALGTYFWRSRERGQRARALALLPLIAFGPLLAMWLFDLPWSLSAIVEVRLLVAVLTAGALLGNAMHYFAARRWLPPAAFVQQLKLAALGYAAIAPTLWLATGYSHPTSLPEPHLLFLPLPVALVGGVTATSSALLLLAPRFRQAIASRWQQPPTRS